MSAEGQAGLCAICQSAIGEGDVRTACPGCGAPYHAECWAENGGCAVYGCECVPKVEMRSGLEIPAGYWGQEHKPCPVCGQQIMAAALRCRHCGTTFASAAPEESGAFRQRQEESQNLPAMKTRVVWLFILCVAPITAPVAAFFAAGWWFGHRQQLRKLPTFYAVLARIAPIAGFGQICIVAIMAMLYTLFRHG